MNFIETSALHVQKTKKLVEKIIDDNTKSRMKKEHHARLDFYEVFLDYITSFPSAQPMNFFSWYLQFAEMKKEKKSFIGRYLSKGSRDLMCKMMDSCIEKIRTDPTTPISGILRDWIPEDEACIMDIKTDFDISPLLRNVIAMTKEKILFQKTVSSKMKSSLFKLFMASLFHLLLYTIYSNASIAAAGVEIEESKLTDIDRMYLAYNWFFSTPTLITIAILVLCVIKFFQWSIRNWHIKHIHIREQFMDFIPPYSIAKVTAQYNILMSTGMYLNSGSGYGIYDALEAAKSGMSKYASSKIDEIQERILTMPSTGEAVNTYFMGDFGIMISSRANGRDFGVVIDEIADRLSELKREKIMAMISGTMAMLLPAVWLTVIYALIPFGSNVISQMSQLTNNVGL